MQEKTVKTSINTPTEKYNYYENITQFEIAQNQALLAISNQDVEAYNYWSNLK